MLRLVYYNGFSLMVKSHQGLSQIASDTKRLAAKARDGKLQPGTIIVSYLQLKLL